MSISFDNMDFVHSISNSPSDTMDFPSTGHSDHSVTLLNDGPQLSDNDRVLHPPVLLALDSFISILKHLPGLYLDQNLYYIRGAIATSDWAHLRSYAQLVSKFTLTDATNKEISPTAFLRLALSQEPEKPFFPSLTDLVVADANASLSYLEFFLTPSLESLEVLRIPNDQQATLSSFLASLTEKALQLQSLILGPGWFPPSSLQIIFQFNNLCHLELKNEDSKLPLAFFENTGSLPKLETLILDARHISNIESKTTSNSTIPPSSFPSGDSNLMDGKRNEDGSDDVLFSQTRYTPFSTSGNFNQLSKLHVVGWLPLLDDLIPRIMSTRLEDVSVTFIRLSSDEMLAKANEEVRKRDEAIKRKKQMAVSKGKKKGWGQEAWSETDEECLNKQEAQKRLALATLSFDIHTKSFMQFFRLLFHRWTLSLKKFSVCQLGGSFQHLLKPPTLPAEIFQELLILPAIENLEMKGWKLDSVESVLNVAESIPNLKSLLLPLDETNSGISLPTLRHIAKSCPKLESFQCRIDSLSLIPEYTIPTTETLSHGLRTLSVGNSSPHPDAKKLYLIARHLDLLFPHLETITVSKEHNAEQWIFVHELVMMCQAARMDERYRASMTSAH